MLDIFVLFFPILGVLGVSTMFFSIFFFNMNFSIFIQWDLIIYNMKVSFPLFFDYISLMFLGVVLIISSSIFFYSSFYMMEELNKIRFFFLMFLFVLSMIFLILSPNLISMLLGWDGLGLVSYCLVIFYHNSKSFSAGMVTALTNRVGDVFILGSIGLMNYMGSWNYMNFMNLQDNLFVFFFVLASMTKSAQIPFSSWLPAAMAAPTPVSSLVHSSTLVTAGIYILIRLKLNFSSMIFLIFLLSFSILTMLMSGLSAILEYDLKKIIALSTLSQLGFMMATLSLGLQNLAFFHLITHACFKALLFMCAGIFIHSSFENQDIRFFGKLNKNFSFPLMVFNIANLSLCGFPFLSGFFSKDLILELCLMKSLNFFFFFLFMVGTFLTVFYSVRLLYFMTYGFSYCLPLNLLTISKGMLKSLIFLFLMSITFGYVFSKLFLFPYNFIIIPFFMKIFIFLLCLISFFLSLLFSKFSLFLIFKKLQFLFILNLWFLNFLKTDFLKKKFFYFSGLVLNLSIFWIEVTYGKNMILSLNFFSSYFNKFFKQFLFLGFSTIFMYMVFLLILVN